MPRRPCDARPLLACRLRGVPQRHPHGVRRVHPRPLILHICGDTADRIGYIRETGLAGFHFDSKVPAATARRLAGDRLALMGGTSNFRIVREGTPETIAADVAEKLSARIDILGPECAVPLDAPYRNMRIFVDEVRRQSRSRLS